MGLYGTRNFYLDVHDPDLDDDNIVRIGVWHVLPKHLAKRFSKELKIDEVIFKLNSVRLRIIILFKQ